MSIFLPPFMPRTKVPVVIWTDAITTSRVAATQPITVFDRALAKPTNAILIYVGHTGPGGSSTTAAQILSAKLGTATMTRIFTSPASLNAGGAWFYLLNPPTGTQELVVTANTNIRMGGAIYRYNATGVKAPIVDYSEQQSITSYPQGVVFPTTIPKPCTFLIGITHRTSTTPFGTMAGFSVSRSFVGTNEVATYSGAMNFYTPGLTLANSPYYARRTTVTAPMTQLGHSVSCIRLEY